MTGMADQGHFMQKSGIEYNETISRNRSTVVAVVMTCN